MTSNRHLPLRSRVTTLGVAASLILISYSVGCSERGLTAMPERIPGGSQAELTENASSTTLESSTTANGLNLDFGVDAPTRKARRSTEAFLAKMTHAVAIGWWTPQQRGRRERSLDPNDRRGVPKWNFDEAFTTEAFRFVRVRYNSVGGYGPFGKWFTDYPDSDLNFSFRLQQLTTMNVHPEPLYLELTDPKIFDYPFMYMIEPGFIWLSDAEVIAMREYFERGGFIMVDDFWGEEEWYNFYLQMKRVFPDREPAELPLEHPIFHLVYDLSQKPQVPSIHNWMRYGVTYERQDAKEVHYRAFFDDDGRIVMMICHNTDLGDGWEREGESREYFETFSEKWAYPMGINIVVYAMTH
jgi:hypothetical protein